MTNQGIEKYLEERIGKIIDRKDKLELKILLEILKSLNKLTLNIERYQREQRKAIKG